MQKSIEVVPDPLAGVEKVCTVLQTGDSPVDWYDVDLHRAEVREEEGKGEERAGGKRQRRYQRRRTARERKQEIGRGVKGREEI